MRKLLYPLLALTPLALSMGVFPSLELVGSTLVFSPFHTYTGNACVYLLDPETLDVEGKICPACAYIGFAADSSHIAIMCDHEVLIYDSLGTPISSYFIPSSDSGLPTLNDTYLYILTVGYNGNDLVLYKSGTFLWRLYSSTLGGVPIAVVAPSYSNYAYVVLDDTINSTIIKRVDVTTASISGSLTISAFPTPYTSHCESADVMAVGVVFPSSTAESVVFVNTTSLNIIGTFNISSFMSYGMIRGISFSPDCGLFAVLTVDYSSYYPRYLLIILDVSNPSSPAVYATYDINPWYRGLDEAALSYISWAGDEEVALTGYCGANKIGVYLFNVSSGTVLRSNCLVSLSQGLVEEGEELPIKTEGGGLGIPSPLLLALAPFAWRAIKRFYSSS